MRKTHAHPAPPWRRAGFLLLALVVAVLGLAPAAAAAPPYATDATLTSLEFTQSTVTSGSDARLDGAWSLPDDPATPAGFSVTLPAGLQGLSDSFNLLDPDGVVMGSCVVTATALNCDIDDDYVAANPRNLQGTFNFWATVTTTVTEATEVTYDFGDVSSTVTVVPPDGPCEDCTFEGLENDKYGAYERSDNTIFWVIDIEAPVTGMAGGETVSVLERLGPNQTLQMDGARPLITVTTTNVVDAEGNLTDWQEIDSTQVLTPEGWLTTFVTEPGMFYSLEVFVDVTDAGAAGIYRNAAEITIEGQETVSVSGEVRRQGGGGTGSGTGVGTFSVTKQVDWNGQPVSGLTFDGTYTVTAPDGSVAVADGTFSVGEGATWTSPSYPTGSVIHLEETLPSGPAGIIWADPEFSRNDFVVGDGSTTAVTLTNTATRLNPSFSLVKSTNGEDADQAPGPEVEVGGAVTWTYVVTNTGDVPIHDVSVTDDQGVVVPVLPASGDTDGDGVLGVDEVWTFEATGTATRGQYRNVGTVVGSYDDDNDPGTPRVDLDPETNPSHYLGLESGLTLDKRVASVTDVDDDGLTDAGDEIRWEFELTNTGDVTLTDLAVDDPLAGAVTCPAGPLAPGASVTCVADAAYVITPADVDAGSVLNVAIAKGEKPGGDPADPADDVPSNEDETETPTDPAPSLVLDKKVASVTDVNGNGLTDLGDEIRWEFELTNSGNVTLTDLAVDDPLAGAVTCPAGPLAAGASTTCTADDPYVITQADVDAGSVVNVATATGERPGGDPTDPADDVPSNEDETETPTDREPGLALDKKVASVTDVDDNGRTDAGDEIRWEFTLTNTGNVTLSDPEVDDPLAGAVTCPAGPLAPGASVTCTTDDAYVITQADVDAGSVVNVATATAEPPGGDPADPTDDVPSNEDETETPTDQEAGLDLDKKVASVTDVNDNGRTDAGDEIRWEFVLTNTGTLTLSDLRVDDPLVEAAGIAIVCPDAPLAPGESVVCRTEDGYAITAADVRKGEVHNVATAVGEKPDGDPTNPTDDVPSNEDDTRTPTGEVAGVDDPPGGDTEGGVLPDTDGGVLPDTGGPAAWWLGGGLLLVLMGALALVDWRRLRRAWVRG